MKEQANSTTPLVYQETKDESRQGMSRFRVTLGVMPDYISDTKGLKLDGVTKGGPASNAGLQTGDVIVKMEDKDITNIYDYMNSLSQFKAGQTIKVVVKRNDQELEFDVTF